MRLRYTFLIINVALLLIFCINNAFGQQIWTIVLDAGHGGKDPGAVYGKSYEKNINLAVALATGAILEKKKNIKVVYTRRDDRFVELVERSNIAADKKANLFVSIHVNASSSKQARGTETFVMGVGKSSANLSVAMRENGVISLESNYSTKYEGYDPTSSESHIMFSLMQYAYTNESLELAAMIQRAYKSGGRHDRGVKQEGFLVLWRNAMPSVLTELGFLSNSNDREQLISKSGQQQLATALAQSIITYVSNNKKPSSSGIIVAPRTTKTTKKATKKATKTTTLATKTKTKPKIRITPLVTSQATARKASVYYCVQVRATSAPIAMSATNFGVFVMGIKERKIKNLYKYSIGELYLYKDALLLQDKVRTSYPDAFIVAYNNRGEQISVRDARMMLENR